jgi:hypothetical protein
MRLWNRSNAKPRRRNVKLETDKLLFQAPQQSGAKLFRTRERVISNCQSMRIQQAISIVQFNPVVSDHGPSTSHLAHVTQKSVGSH